MTTTDSSDSDLRGLAGWVTLAFFGVLFSVAAFWLLQSVDGRDRRTSGPVIDPILVVTTTSVDADELALAPRPAEQSPTAAVPSVTVTEPEAGPTPSEIQAEWVALYDELGIDGQAALIDGVWLLIGVAPSGEAKAEIAGFGRRIDGVTRMRNQLVVAGDLGSPATEQSTVITVDAGQVVLRGAVFDEETGDAVVAAAQSVFGAGNVIDELVIGADAEGRVVIEGSIAASNRRALNFAAQGLEAIGLTIDSRSEFVELTASQQALQEELDAAVAELVINFVSGSATLADSEAAKLIPIIVILSDATDVLVAVEGYTDDQGDPAGNQELSRQRAEAVVTYLVEQGVDAALLRSTGNGESLPIADNATAAGRAQNRRTEFRVVL